MANQKVAILRVTEEGRTETEDVVAEEFPLTILLNNKELVTLLCSPFDMDSLAVGFLFSEGLLKSRDEIGKIAVDAQRGLVRVETRGNIEPDSNLLTKRFITSGCGRGASFYSAADVGDVAKVESRTAISAHDVFALTREFQHHSEVYRSTGGVHSAALCDTKNILVFAEDIGRHNAIDKIFGHCLLNNIITDGHIIVTSGRVSSEILLKVVKRTIPIIISVSAATNLAVKLAGDLGLTLIGFVRGKRMNVYSNGWRIT